MNWGNKITLVLIIFVIAMGSMVYVASMQTNEMMDSNYYDKEIKFQGQIDASDNLQRLTGASLFKNINGVLEVIIPEAACTHITKGTIHFLRNDNELKDLTMELKPDSNGHQIINNPSIINGLYKASIQWENEGKPYYYEENILITL